MIIHPKTFYAEKKLALAICNSYFRLHPSYFSIPHPKITPLPTTIFFFYYHYHNYPSNPHFLSIEF